MTPFEVHLVAYDVLEAALEARQVANAVEPIRQELETLDREDLIRVATAIAVEAALKLTAPVERHRLRERVQKARLNVMWEASS